ncbi:hypothetical protein LCGC14_1678490 [marine sediment metagenome]|uniref:Uncharacterized protein n=1 Tax=marine sediment metagenome TaxID=412755 RepID=A0A0F9KPA1_9ZZZZ
MTDEEEPESVEEILRRYKKKTKEEMEEKKMAMSIFEYNQDKSKPEEKSRAADVESILETMSELEEYTGTTEAKIHEIYYEIKRQLRQALTVEVEQPKK